MEGLCSADKSNVEAALSALLENAEIATNQSAICSQLIEVLSAHPDLNARVLEVFALLAREESFRSIASGCGVLSHLVPLLASTQSDVRLQALRAIGNLCIDNDANREQVLSNGGCPHLNDQLTRCLDEKSAESQSERIRAVTCGCLLNLANDNEVLSKALFELDVVSRLAKLVASSESEMVSTMALQAISAVIDHASQDVESLTSSPLPSALSLSLQRSNSGDMDLMEEVMAIIEILIKNDQWKLSLTQCGLVEHLLNITELNYQQKAMDFVVLLLSEDASLKLVFEDGSVVNRAIDWLSSNSTPLQRKANAAMIIANMARNEANCVELVSKGIVPLLISQARTEEPKELFGKLHYSSLSALRNLSIPAAHKESFLKDGVVDVAMETLTQSTQAHVQFKAMSILRLLTEKQAATCSRIASVDGTISRICEVCSAIGPAHMQQEGSRLCAAVVKNCNDTDVMVKVTSEGAVKWIATLLGSEFVVMVNEGLIALILLLTTQKEEVLSAVEKIDEPDIATRTAQVLSSMSSSPEVLLNCLVLAEKIYSSNSDVLKSMLESSELLRSALKELLCHANEEVKSNTENLSTKLYNEQN